MEILIGVGDIRADAVARLLAGQVGDVIDHAAIPFLGDRAGNEVAEDPEDGNGGVAAEVVHRQAVDDGNTDPFIEQGSG